MYTSILSTLFHFTGTDGYFERLLSSWLLMMFIAAVVCFLVGELTRNYSQVDKLWSLMPVAYSLLTLFYCQSVRVLIMSLLVVIWSSRLTYNFARKGGYNIIPWKGVEDYRWKVVREHPLLKGRFRSGLFNLLFISSYQHFLILLFSAPLLVAAINPATVISLLDFIAALLMLLFIIVESIADNQQFRFQNLKKQAVFSEKIYLRSLKQGFLSEGLWEYVRHPNFASEQAIWLSFYLFSVSASGNWINPALAGPVLLMLLFMGSTTLSERISSGKYPDYAAYQKRVPKFIPKLFRLRKS